ncbi:hypothetical protein C0J52_10815 [Blattella germanica]|nr:hypothetical protein C0J52_10815 [Blattella germanica]
MVDCFSLFVAILQLLELVVVLGSIRQKLHSHCGRKKHYDCWGMQTKLGEITNVQHQIPSPYI